MRRRDFIAGAGGATVTSVLPATAQQTKKLPVVAVVFSNAPVAEMVGADPKHPLARAFIHGLRDLGWIEGRTLMIERRSVEGDLSRAPDIFAELAARGVDVIIMSGTQPLFAAAQKATRTIPVVTTFRADPVAGGLIASLARPGGNLTGIANESSPEFYLKRLQLLLELAPRVSKVAYLAQTQQLEQFRSVARPAGVTIVDVELERAEQFDAAFASCRRENVNGLMFEGAGLTFVHAQRIVSHASENALPAVFAFREAVDAGGLISYGANIVGTWRQLASLVDRFLKGAKLGEVPVELPTKFELIINAKTARTLGLTIPPLLLARADEVIE